jgi:hypothetical protein
VSLKRWLVGVWVGDMRSRALACGLWFGLGVWVSISLCVPRGEAWTFSSELELVARPHKRFATNPSL